MLNTNIVGGKYIHMFSISVFSADNEIGQSYQLVYFLKKIFMEYDI